MEDPFEFDYNKLVADIRKKHNDKIFSMKKDSFVRQLVHIHELISQPTAKTDKMAYDYLEEVLYGPEATKYLEYVDSNIVESIKNHMNKCDK
jgi:hypothetical protein